MGKFFRHCLQVIVLAPQTSFTVKDKFMSILPQIVLFIWEARAMFRSFKGVELHD